MTSYRLLIGEHEGGGLPGITLEEGTTQFGMWAMLAAPLIMGNDLRNVSDAAKVWTVHCLSPPAFRQRERTLMGCPPHTPSLIQQRGRARNAPFSVHFSLSPRPVGGKLYQDSFMLTICVDGARS